MGCCWLSREHVHTCHLYISTCAPFVDLDIFLNAWHSGLRIDFCLSLHFQVYVFFIYTIYVIECNEKGLCAYKPYTTFSNGSLGSRIDEERSEMR